MKQEQDHELLKELRDRYDYCVQEWADIRREGRIDMQYVAGDPWAPQERQQREKSKRPCLAFDEIGQYVNQCINNLRANPRGITVLPRGAGATDDTAELRQGMIRQIEYESKAASAYVTAYENAVQRSYGYFRVSVKYRSPRSMERELCIKRIPNPDTVYLDPDSRESDYSDMRYAFVLEEMSHEEFKQRWPAAEIRDFSDFLNSHPAWIKEKRIQVAEYWKVKTAQRELLLLSDGNSVYSDEHEPEEVKAAGLQVLDSRKTEDRRVCQYITNGIETLETTEWGGNVTLPGGRVEWRGSWIPIFPIHGKEIFVDLGTGSRRMLLSLVRHARDPQMLYNYARTCQSELAGMTPKTPFMGYEGQFMGHEEDWQNINQVPLPYLQARERTAATPPGVVLPLPQRQPYDPPIERLEMLAEASRRAIQAAMGMYDSSVGKRDPGAKSGVALRELDRQSQEGSFHLMDNHDRTLEHCGRVLDELLPVYYNTPRDVAIRKNDDSQKAIRINEPTTDPDTQEPKTYAMSVGEHDVTVSTGPSYQSQREQSNEFADAIGQNQQVLGAALGGNPAAQKLVAMSIKLKNLGPLGDEMAEAFEPDDPNKLPAEVQQAMQKKDMELQALNAHAAEIEKELAELKQGTAIKGLEIDSKERIAEAANESRERIAAVNAQVEVLKTEVAASTAELRGEIDAVKLMIQALAAENEPAPETVP